MDGKEQRILFWIAVFVILIAAAVTAVRYQITRPRQIFSGSLASTEPPTPNPGELIAIEPFQRTPLAAPADLPTIPSAIVLPQPTASQERRPPVLIISIDPGIYADQRSAFDTEIKQVFAYVQERFGSAGVGPINVDVVQNQQCSLEGLAYPDQRILQVYTCDTINRSRAVDIMAHEFVHQLAYDRYGEQSQGADTLLVEGVATWAAGAYWLNTQPDFRTFVREQRNAGVAPPLVSSIEGVSNETLNSSYYQWASFVEFLITTYGRSAFDRLYITGPGSGDVGSADYLGVYGKDIELLEQEWQIWLDQ